MCVARGESAFLAAGASLRSMLQAVVLTRLPLADRLAPADTPIDDRALATASRDAPSSGFCGRVPPTLPALLVLPLLLLPFRRLSALSWAAALLELKALMLTVTLLWLIEDGAGRGGCRAAAALACAVPASARPAIAAPAAHAAS